MLIYEVIGFAIAIVFLWGGIITMIGVVRFNYWPLLFFGTSQLLWAVYAINTVSSILPINSGLSLLLGLVGAICYFIFEFGFHGSRTLHNRGITYRQLFYLSH
jgi:hypothetical protein